MLTGKARMTSGDKLYSSRKETKSDFVSYLVSQTDWFAKEERRQ